MMYTLLCVVSTLETATGITIQLPRGCLMMFTRRRTITPLLRCWGFPYPTQFDLQLNGHDGHREEKQTRKVPWLSI